MKYWSSDALLHHRSNDRFKLLSGIVLMVLGAALLLTALAAALPQNDVPQTLYKSPVQ